MSSINWDELSTLFDTLCNQSNEEQKQYLNTIQNNELKQELESLLFFHQKKDQRFDFDQQPNISAFDQIDWTNRIVGAFQLKEKIGEGGMGVVYLAHRVKGDFEQKVAIKLLKNLWQENDTLIQERNLLASLDHPNITFCIDGGNTAEGYPWFAMQFTPGIPIDEYALQNRLSLKELITLFISVTDAINYAHAQFVLHLDIKPNNILVQEDKGIKVLDFGIAQMIGPKAEPNKKWGYTERFAAPEQIQNTSLKNPFNISTDVYALGSLLEYLITQLNLKNTTDVQLIINKAKAQYQKDRYQSVESFRRDLKSYLNYYPISIRKDWTNVFSKWVFRNKAYLSLFTLFLTVITIGIFYYTQALKTERDEAIKQELRAKKVVELLQNVFETSDPSLTSGKRPTIDEVLESGSSNVLNSLSDDPETYHQLAGTLAKVFHANWKLRKADSLSSIVILYLEQLPNDKKSEYRKDLHQAYLLKLKIKTEAFAFDSVTYFLDKLESFQSNEEKYLTLKSKLGLRYQQKKYQESLEIIVNLENYSDKDLKDIAHLYFMKGACYRKLKLFDSARYNYFKALTSYQNLFKPPHPNLAEVNNHIASLFQNMGDYSRSIPYAYKSYKQREKIFGLSNMATIASYANMARAYVKIKDYDSALYIYKKIVPTFKQAHGTKHPYYNALNQALYKTDSLRRMKE